MSYIYKISNKLNQKVYIGYTSRTLKRRFYEHTWEAFNSSEEENKSCLYSAFRKYGLDLFTIEKVYEFNEANENWEELEKFYINKFNSLTPNGYNILLGGNKPPVHYGDENIKTKISDEELPNLIKMLQNNSIPYSTIAAQYKVSISQLYRINSGKSRYNDTIDYPIRKLSQDEEYALMAINLLQNDNTLSNKKIADLIPNYFRANEIASINHGKKFAYLWDKEFPIRKVKVPDNYEEKQIKAQEVVQYIIKEREKEKSVSLTSLWTTKNFGVSRPVIEKIVKGIYPYRLEGIEYPIKLK